MKKVLPHNSFSYNETVKNSQSQNTVQMLYTEIRKTKYSYPLKLERDVTNIKIQGYVFCSKLCIMMTLPLFFLFFLDSLSLIEGLAGMRNKRLKKAMPVGWKEDKKEKWGREGNMRQTL